MKVNYIQFGDRIYRMYKKIIGGGQFVPAKRWELVMESWELTQEKKK